MLPSSCRTISPVPAGERSAGCIFKESIRKRSSCRRWPAGFIDVAVDVRRKSPHFGKWVATELNDENHRQMYIPPGFAHGFCVLSDSADLYYKCTDFYYPQHERTLLWNDPSVGIRWPLEVEPILSDKDRPRHAVGGAGML